MSHPLTLTTTELIAPMTPEAIRKHRQKQYESAQLVAATLAQDYVGNMPFAGTIVGVYLAAQDDAAAGESMTYDVEINGTSALTGVYTQNDTIDTTQLLDLSSLIDPTANSFSVGDIIDTARVYTAGGGPTPIAANTLFIVVERTET